MALRRRQIVIAMLLSTPFVIDACIDTGRRPRLAAEFYYGGGPGGQGKKEKPGDCVKDKPVTVRASIWGGRSGRSITVKAKCADVVVAECKATDPGDSSLDNCESEKVQVAGKASCEHIEEGIIFDSSWTVSCIFKN